MVVSCLEENITTVLAGAGTHVLWKGRAMRLGPDVVQEG
jgi:hypothetical protein